MRLMNKKLLILFALAVFFKQLVWIVLIPVFQTPDEQAHFAQVQNAAENNIPGVLSTSKEIITAEKFLGVYRDSAGNNSFTYHPEYRIPYTNSVVGYFENKINNIPQSDRKKLVKNEATWYPPLYYNFSAIGYKIAYSGSIIDRVFFIRFWQSIIYLLTIFVYYLLAKQLFKSSVLIFSFMTFISFLPMPSYVVSGVTSDNLMNLLFPLPIFLGVKIIKDGVKSQYLIAFLFSFALGFLTKPHFVIALPIFALAVVTRKIYEKQVKELFLYLALFTVIIFIYYFRGILLLIKTGEISSLIPDIGTSEMSIRKISLFGIISYFSLVLQKTYRETLPWFWGVFRWLSFALNRWYYRFFNFLLVVSGVMLAIRLLVKIKSQKKIIDENNLAEIFLYSSVIIYFIILTLWDYLFFLSHGFSLGLQGRYYFPVLFPIIFFIFKNISTILKKQVLIKIFGAVMIPLNFYALFEIAKSYYSFSSLKEFLFEFSQYKPEILKGYAIIYILIAYIFLLFSYTFQLFKQSLKINEK